MLPIAHGRVRAFCLACAAALVAVAPSAACRRAAPPEPLAVALVTPPGETRAAIDLAGLTDDERAALKDDAPAAVWESLLEVSVQAANPEAPPPAVAGRYSVTDRGVRFTPAFPFQPGRRYDVRVDLGRFRRDEPHTLATTVALPRGETPAAEARVMGISPAGDTVPENLLRFYVWFSAPMSREAGLPHVTLIDERSGVVADAFLPVDGGFWNHDFTRYTLFFDPGRVKVGILPNERMGRPLVAGRRYRWRLRRRGSTRRGRRWSSRSSIASPRRRRQRRRSTSTRGRSRCPSPARASRSCCGRRRRSTTPSRCAPSASRRRAARKSTATSRWTSPTRAGSWCRASRGAPAATASWRSRRWRIRPATASAAPSRRHRRSPPAAPPRLTRPFRITPTS